MRLNQLVSPLLWGSKNQTPCRNGMLKIIAGVALFGCIGSANADGLIQAESYSAMSGVQTETTSDTGGGLNLGYLDAGDWLNYSTNISAAGSYRVSYRVASLNGGGALQLEKAGGNPVYGSMNVIVDPHIRTPI